MKIEELSNSSQTVGEYKVKKQESFQISRLFNAESAAVCRKRRQIRFFKQALADQQSLCELNTLKNGRTIYECKRKGIGIYL
ncbi:hypothetical protein DXC40_04685 [Anaerotruncus colihominis]|uniref:Uncharacterized protein n=1 Tax=Anaerotruncus colihominis TaxID=169435 RepID=A0A3E3ITG0_9FIRM|nr:hypothetical protein DXC40_04685 [Anaerotruncus colihominis]